MCECRWDESSAKSSELLITASYSTTALGKRTLRPHDRWWIHWQVVGSLIPFSRLSDWSTDATWRRRRAGAHPARAVRRGRRGGVNVTRWLYRSPDCRVLLGHGYFTFLVERNGSCEARFPSHEYTTYLTFKRRHGFRVYIWCDVTIGAESIKTTWLSEAAPPSNRQKITELTVGPSGRLLKITFYTLDCKNDWRKQTFPYHWSWNDRKRAPPTRFCSTGFSPSANAQQVRVRRRQQRVYFDQYWWKVKTLHQRFSLFPLLFYSRTLFLSSIHPT